MSTLDMIRRTMFAAQSRHPGDVRAIYLGSEDFKDARADMEAAAAIKRRDTIHGPRWFFMGVPIYVVDAERHLHVSVEGY